MKDSFTAHESDNYLKIELHEPKKWYMEFASKFIGFVVGLIFIGFLILSGYQLVQMILFDQFRIGMIFTFLLSISVPVFIWFVVKTQVGDNLYTEVVVMTPQTFLYSRSVMFVTFMNKTINLKEIDAYKVLGDSELSENIDENEELEDLTDEEIEDSEMSDEEIIRILAEEQRLEEERVKKITLSDGFKKEVADPKKDFKIEVVNWKEPLYIGRSITSWDAKTVALKMEKFRMKYFN